LAPARGSGYRAGVITSVALEGFRGVREGGVEGLAPISILVGPNNQSKSTVLEAIATVGYGKRADEVVKLLLRRGGPPLVALEHVVTWGATKARLMVKQAGGGNASLHTTELVTPVRVPALRQAAIDAGLAEPLTGLQVGNMVVWVDAAGKLSSLFTYNSSPVPLRGEDLATSFQVRFVDVETVRGSGALEDAYSDIERAGKVDTVVRALQRSMAGLRDLRILKTHDRFILHAFYEATRQPVPAFVAGDGFKRFLEVAAATVGTSKGVVLLEEPESFQHPRYLQELATLLHLAAREGTQIILSTHSLELCDLLLLAPEAEGQTYPAVHRMRIIDGKLRATTIPRENAVRGREDLLEDLRA
jgi:predicted ATPase